MKIVLKYSVAMALILGLSSMAKAQQEAQFSQFLDNMLYFNPAYAGNLNVLNITAVHHQQWVGMDGAPMSTSLAIHSPLNYDNVGLGLSVLNDRVGPVNSTWINADVSYTVRFKKNKGNLSFGVKGGINLLNGDLMALEKNDQNDVVANTLMKNEVKPNFGVGIYYHTEKWFAGVAVPRILDNLKDAGQTIDPDFISQRHYYLTGGAIFKVNRMLKIRPSAMVKLTQNAPADIDVDLAFILYDKIFLAANYRVIESAGVYFQYQFLNKLKIGYAFQFPTSKLRIKNFGTHELLVSYSLAFHKNDAMPPRFF